MKKKKKKALARNNLHYLLWRKITTLCMASSFHLLIDVIAVWPILKKRFPSFRYISCLIKNYLKDRAESSLFGNQLLAVMLFYHRRDGILTPKKKEIKK